MYFFSLAEIDPCQPNPCYNGGSCFRETVGSGPAAPPSGTHPELPDGAVLPGGPPSGTLPDHPEGGILPESPQGGTMPEQPGIGNLPGESDGQVEHPAETPDIGTHPEDSQGEIVVLPESPQAGTYNRRRRETRPADPGYAARPVEPSHDWPVHPFQCACLPGFTGPRCGQSEYARVVMLVEHFRQQTPYTDFKDFKRSSIPNRRCVDHILSFT